MELIGEIKLFAGNFEPRGWLFCDGRSLSISRNQTLFSILGITYGGNSENFNIPNLPDFNGSKYIICVDGNYPSKF
jgi:microcystin-dependent protein